MPYYRRKRRRYLLWPRLLRGLGVLFGLGVLGGVWWWLAQLGPRDVGPGEDEAETVVVDGARVAWGKEMAELRRDLIGARGEEALALWDELVAGQRRIVQRGNSSQSEQRLLEALERERDSAWAEVTNPRIAAWVEQGMTARAAGDVAGAESGWREALALQTRVNRSGAGPALKDFVREGRLEQDLQELVAAPLGAEVGEARRVAAEAEAEGRWADALAALMTAREVQMRINADFARSRHADLRRLDEIDRAIESLDAAGMATAVDEQEAEGDRAVAEESFAEAVTFYEAARQTQLRLNREFGRSRFLSSPRVEQLEIKRQTASSRPLLAGIGQDLVVIDDLLRRREVGMAGERITRAAARLEDVFDQLPKSEALDDGVRLKLGYLASQVERLGEIQDAVHERLRALPGVSERRMLNTEFPQSLYVQVMRTNPSRQAGRAHPVDSVNWMEAMACCERLGWILGRPVRLPTADEFRIAVGDPTVVTWAEGAAEPATGSRPMGAQSANDAGFFDLLGNVAEWLQPGAEQSELQARVGGGSYRDAPERLRKVPVEALARTERSRHVGFRVLVAFDPEM